MEANWLEEEQWMGATALAPVLALRSTTSLSTALPTHKQSIPIAWRKVRRTRVFKTFSLSTMHASVPRGIVAHHTNQREYLCSEPSNSAVHYASPGGRQVA